MLQGKIVATGYRYTTPPADPSKLDADDLLQGGPAVSIEGNVGQGHHPRHPAQGQQHDRHRRGRRRHRGQQGRRGLDRFPMARRRPCGSARPGASPSARPKATGTGFGLIVDGGIAGDGVYAGVDGNGLQIGGMGGTRVDRQRHRRRAAIDPGQVASIEQRRPSASVRALRRRSCAMPARSSRPAATPPRRSRRRSTLRRAPTCRSCATAARSAPATGDRRHGDGDHRQVGHA